MDKIIKNAIFNPVKVGRAGEEVALQIEAAIIDGRLALGERLPSERALQAHFGTGRGVIREALGVLKQKGLIEVKKGAKGGAFVKQVDMTRACESLGLFLKQRKVDPNYMIEFRESLDRTITGLAITRGTAEEKEKLLAYAHHLSNALKESEPDIEMIFEIDRNLNLLLAKMTKNPVFEWIMWAMQSGLGSHDHALYINAEYRDITADNWVKTAEGIANNELVRTLSFIGYHYVMLRNCLVAEEADRQPENPGALLTDVNAAHE